MTTAFRRIQIGLEATRGTALAADKVMLGTLTMTPQVTFHRPTDERNTLAEFHRAVAVAQSTKLRFEGDATYEQLIDWLSMAVKGAISPSTPEGSARLWTFTPNLTSKNVQDSYTFEYGDDQQAWESAFTICENLELGITLGEVMTVRADLFAKFAAKTTFTGALSVPALITEVVANHMKFYVDGSWANIGNTESASLLAGATVRLGTGIRPSNRADGSLDFATVSESKRHLEIDLDFIMSSAAMTEYDAYVANTLRAIRLELIGGIADMATNYQVNIDILGKYVSEPELFTDRDGEDIMRMTIHSEEDGSGNEMSFAVTNKEITL